MNENITRPDVITPEDVNSIDNDGTITSDDVKALIPGYPNLVPFGSKDKQLSHEKATEYGRRGGLKSGEVRKQRAKERRTAQDILKAIAEYQMSDDQVQTVIGDEGRAILGDDKAAYAVMLCRQLLQGMDGDTKAAQFVRDTMGDAPVTKTETTAEIITSDDVSLIESVRDVLTG